MTMMQRCARQLVKWLRKLLRSNRKECVDRCIFELELPAASIVIQVFDNHAIGQAISARHLVVHVAVHATMLLCLCQWAMRTIVVIVSRKRHRARL